MMRLSRCWILLCLCAFVLCAAGSDAFAAKKAAPKKTTASTAAKKPSPKTAASKAPSKKATKKSAKKSSPKKAHAKKAKSTPPAEEAKAKLEEEIPLQAEISPAVVDALAAGDVNGAVLLLREERANPKILYLTREATRIANFGMSKKPDRAEAHKVYQNAGISYHNLYLFLKARGIDQPLFFKEAERLYDKARGAGTLLHRAECDLLLAALLAASGDLEKAQKKYAKIDDAALRGDFESMEYLAAYHAATGNVEGTLAALDAAHRLNPDATLTWLAVGDDFHAIAQEPEFKALMVTWKAQEASQRLTLTLPKSEKPRLQVTDDTGIFRPQKSMPHYDLKKGVKKPPKKAAVSSTKSSKGSKKPVAAKKKSSPTATTKKKR